MIAILAALALAAAAPPADAAQPDDPAATLEELKTLYDQSCANREYGAFDDVCDQLQHQVKAAQIEVDRAAQRQAAKPHPAAAPKPPRPASTPAEPAPAPAPTPPGA